MRGWGGVGGVVGGGGRAFGADGGGARWLGGARWH